MVGLGSDSSVNVNSATTAAQLKKTLVGLQLDIGGPDLLVKEEDTLNQEIMSLNPAVS